MREELLLSFVNSVVWTDPGCLTSGRCCRRDRQQYFAFDGDERLAVSLDVEAYGRDSAWLFAFVLIFKFQMNDNFV